MAAHWWAITLTCCCCGCTLVCLCILPQVLILGFITGTLFLKGSIPTDTVNGGTLYLGLIFYSIVQLMFNSFAEMHFMVSRRCITAAQGPVLISTHLSKQLRSASV